MNAKGFRIAGRNARDASAYGAQPDELQPLAVKSVSFFQTAREIIMKFLLGVFPAAAAVFAHLLDGPSSRAIRAGPRAVKCL